MTTKYKKVRSAVSDTVLELRNHTAALERLSDLIELADVPPERGGYHFSEWERQFIGNLRELDPPIFSPEQRAKIAEIWHAADLRKRLEIDEKPANLFSKLSPQRQDEQLARAARVKLPWEK